MLHRSRGTFPVFTYMVNNVDKSNDTSYVEKVFGGTEGKDNWKITFKKSGTFVLRQPNNARKGIDLFLVGGGGGGVDVHDITDYGGRAGGGAGYTKTHKNLSAPRGSYPIVVGDGGAKASSTSSATTATDGGASSAFGKTANGGKGGYAPYGDSWNAKGGNGGSGGAAHGQQYASQWTQTGGADGADGQGYVSAGVGGAGQHTTTKEFGENGGTSYAQGGGNGTSTTANTGNGGDYNKNGSSGIVIIRNHR